MEVEGFMKAKRSAFNLIEITLAIAVVGIGVAAVMALLVPALNASKDSLADTYTADVVNTFMTYVRGQLNCNWGSSSTITEFTDTPAEISDTANDWDLTKSSPLIPNTGIYLSKNESIFRIKVDPDFTAHMRIWYENLNNSDSDEEKKKNPNQFNKNGTPESLTKDDGIVRFYFELSWPATIPYAARKKSLYVTEFYNRNLEAKRCY